MKKLDDEIRGLTSKFQSLYLASATIREVIAPAARPAYRRAMTWLRFRLAGWLMVRNGRDSFTIVDCPGLRLDWCWLPRMFQLGSHYRAWVFGRRDGTNRFVGIDCWPFRAVLDLGDR